MKWLKDIKANTRPWLTFLSGFAANTSAKSDETAMINDYFATYLQKKAADHISSLSCDGQLLTNEYDDTCQSNLKHPDHPIRTLSPLKQVI